MKGLSLAGSFFSLLKPMFGVSGDPAIRQQGFQRGSVIGSGHLVRWAIGLRGGPAGLITDPVAAR